MKLTTAEIKGLEKLVRLKRWTGRVEMSRPPGGRLLVAFVGHDRLIHSRYSLDSSGRFTEES